MSRPLRHIAVVSTNRDKYSETFIHDGYDALPCRKHLLYGGYLPTHVTTDWRVEGQPLPPAPDERPDDAPDTLARKRLVAWLSTHRPDAVLAHYGPSGLALAEPCELLRIPLVVHFHGYDAYRHDILANQGRRYPWLFAKAQAVVAVSAAMEAQLLRLGARADRLHRCVYGVDLGRFPASDLPEGPLRLLFVGRMVEKKWPLGLLRAFGQAHAQAPDLRLQMVGDGELSGECKAWADASGLGAVVEFSGSCPPEGVAQALRGAHVLVQPSLQTPDGDNEGTPLAVLEAMAAGRAVVGSRHAGIGEVVADGETGLLFAPGDGDALCAALLRLHGDRELVRRLGVAARRQAVAEHAQRDYHLKLWRLLGHVAALGQNS